MIDIIARAKKLAKNGHTPGPWRASLFNGVRNDDGSSNFECGIYPEDHGPPPIFLTSSGIDERDAHVIAFAAEAVEALAEEKWEFTAQVFMNQHWVFMWSPTSGNSVYGKWHATREIAEKFSEQWLRVHPTRIVRRRVSPVEVVDD